MNKIVLNSLPFKHGSEVEVIILAAGEEEGIFSFTEKVVQKKKIAPMGMKQIEKVVYEVRAGK